MPHSNRHNDELNRNLLIQERPNDYQQLAMAMQQPRQQQQPQQGGMPQPNMQMMQKFIPGMGGEAAGEAAGGEAGGGFMDGAGSAASNPYTWLAALLSWKAYDTKKRSGVDFNDQLKNISLAPQRDSDRWGLEKIGPFGGDDVYKGTFDLASGDISGWHDANKAPFRALREKWKDIF